MGQKTATWALSPAVYATLAKAPANSAMWRAGDGMGIKMSIGNVEVSGTAETTLSYDANGNG